MNRPRPLDAPADLDHKTQRQVERAHVLGQSAHRNTIDAGLRDRAHGREVDVSRSFKDGSTGSQRHGCTHLIEVHIVEQYHFRAGCQGFAQLIERLDFDLDELAASAGCACEPVRVRQRRFDTSGSGDVVLLDQDPVVQTKPVVATPSTVYSVFLRQAEAGNGLSCIDHLRFRTAEEVGETTRLTRHTREQLKKIQGTAFSRQQSTRVAVDLAEQLARRNRLAIVRLPSDVDRWIELAETACEPGTPTEDGSFARDDLGTGERSGGNQLRREVTAADILAQRSSYVAFDFALEGRCKGHDRWRKLKRQRRF